MMINFILCYRSGQKAPLIYTELLPGNQGLALMITSMTEQMAGTYYCTASYANTELLTTSVKIETFSKFSLMIEYLLSLISLSVLSRLFSSNYMERCTT